MKNINEDFFMKEQYNNGKKLVYFDNASTTFKPKQMIDGINDYYKNYTSNVYRGDYINSEKASMKLDEASCLFQILFSLIFQPFQIIILNLRNIFAEHLNLNMLKILQNSNELSFVL